MTNKQLIDKRYKNKDKILIYNYLSTKNMVYEL